MKLDLTWIAQFKNGEILLQFEDEEQTQEHLFKEVLERANELQGFQLANERTKVLYSVDLTNGRLRVAPPIGTLSNVATQPPEPEVCGTDKYAYRLIYFRRVTRQMTWDGNSVGDKGITDIQYFLGFQYKDEKGKNVKRLLQISKDDEVYIA